MPKTSKKSEVDKLKRKVNKLANRVSKPEYKHVDKYATDTSLINFWEVYGLTDLAQGDASGQRDGLTVSLKNASVNFVVSSAASTPIECRALIVWTAGESKSVPAIADILDTTNTDVLAYRNVDGSNTEKYSVLMDRKFILGEVNGTNQMKMFRFNKNMRNAQCRFDGSLDSDYKRGQLFFYIYAEHTIVDEVRYSMNSRVYYTDT